MRVECSLCADDFRAVAVGTTETVVSIALGGDDGLVNGVKDVGMLGFQIQIRTQYFRHKECGLDTY